MIALLSFVPSEGRKCYVNYRPVSPLGVSCVWAEVSAPGRVRERRLFRALPGCAARLSELGVRRAVFGEGFPYRDFFLSRGFDEISAEPLLAVSAGRIAALAASGRGGALLVSDRADRLTMAAAETLCRSFRRLILDVPPGAFEALEEVCAALGAVPETLPRGRAADVDAAVFMCAPAAHILTPAACRAVFVNGGQRYLLGGREVERVSFGLPEKYRFDLPFPALPILSAAVEAGRIEPEEMKISVP